MAAATLHLRISRFSVGGGPLDVDTADSMTLDERIDAGDRFAVFDVLTAAISELELVREELDRHLCGTPTAAPGTLARLNELRAIFSSQDAGGLDAAGKEPRRSGMCRSCPG